MVTIEQNDEIKYVTEKQNALTSKLLQSSAFTKAERDCIVNSIAGKLITSYDSSVLLGYLLAKVRFQKYFNGKRKHKVAECFYCKNKLNLHRYEDINTGIREWICKLCYNPEKSSNKTEVKKNKAVEPATETLHGQEFDAVRQQSEENVNN